MEKLINEFIQEYSNKYDLRFGKPFDRNKANCSWFTKEFYIWCKNKGLDIKIIYFDSDKEAHIVPVLHGKIIDFTIKQFTGRSDQDYAITSPEDYIEYGYDKYEVMDSLPDWLTVKPADKLNSIMRYNQFISTNH